MTNRDKYSHITVPAVLKAPPARLSFTLRMKAAARGAVKFFFLVLEKLYRLEYGDIDEGDEKK